VALSLACAPALGPGSRPALAHTGTAIPLLTDADAGPYRLALWANPEVQEATFWVLLPDATAPAEAFAIALTLAPEDGHAGPRTIQMAWEPSPGVPGEHRYEAITALDAPGAWSVVASVEGPDGHGEANATFEALPEGPTDYEGWASVLPFALLGLLFAGGYWARRRRASSPG